MATSGEFQGSYESFHGAFRLILPFTMGMTLRDAFSEESPLRENRENAIFSAESRSTV